MSTEQAFVHYGDWSKDSDAHPAMGFMRNYTNMIDRKVFDTEPAADWHTDDFTFAKADGGVVKGREEAWKAVGQVYGKSA